MTERKCENCRLWRNIVGAAGGDNYGTCNCEKSPFFGKSSCLEDGCTAHQPKKSPAKTTWGSIYNKYVRRGYDRGAAEWFAYDWEKRHGDGDKR